MLAELDDEPRVPFAIAVVLAGVTAQRRAATGIHDGVGGPAEGEATELGAPAELDVLRATLVGLVEAAEHVDDVAPGPLVAAPGGGQELERVQRARRRVELALPFGEVHEPSAEVVEGPGRIAHGRQ